MEEKKEVKNIVKHYANNKGYDVIDIIEDYNLNFKRGNVLKYIVRAGKKDNELKDLLKARDYLNREIEQIECRQMLQEMFKQGSQ